MKLKLVVGLVVLTILGFTVFGENGLFKLARDQHQRSGLLDEADRLRADNEQLRVEIDLLQNDRSYVERLAREKLGMVKPGEFIFQFTEAKKSRKKAP